MTGNLFAQNTSWTYNQLISVSDQQGLPFMQGWLRHSFMIDLEKGNRIKIELVNKKQLQDLLNMDSVLRIIMRELEPLKDSLANELTTKRINISEDAAGNTRIRTREFQPRGSNYISINGELSLLKIEQDTVVIYRKLKMPKAERVSLRGINSELPYKITLFMNNYSDINNYLDGRIAKGIEQIINDWNNYAKWSQQKNWKLSLSGYYNLTDATKNRPLKKSYNPNVYHSSVAPYVHIAAQAINGRFSPSVAAGIELIKSFSRRHESHFQLYWEPHFHFEHLASGKNKLHRNDFISFQHTSTTFTDNKRDKVMFGQLFSAGYLVNRSGNYFEKNTFKFGFPGVRYDFAFLHPEFVFNNLFKNFQPSLKLMVHLD